MLKRLRQLSLDPDLVSPSTMAALVDLSQKIDHGIKFDDIRNRIVITEDLMRDLRISSVQDRTPRDPPPMNASRAPTHTNAWHRSQDNTAAVLYRQSRRYMSSRATFPPGKPMYKPAKNSRELPLFPELSANQCQLFSKRKIQGKRGGRGFDRRRPQTEPTFKETYYQHILCDSEVRRFQQHQRNLKREEAESPTKPTAETKLPEIQTPTPSVREKYIVKWLYAEPNGRSPYITPKDMGFRLGKQRGTPVQHEVNKKINNTPVTPFVNDRKSSLS